MSLASADVGTLAASVAGAGGAITGGTSMNTVACSGGGTRQITTVDGNGNQHLDAGDTVSVVYSHCVTTGMVEDGTVQLTFHATPTGTVGGAAYTLDVTAGMKAYVTTETNRVRETNGTLRVVSSRSAQGQGVDTSTSSGLVLRQTASGVTHSRTLTDYLAWTP